MIIVDISLIKDSVISILAQRAQPPPTVILIYFEGILILIEVFDMSDIGDNMEIGNQRAQFEITSGCRDPDYYTSASTSTSEFDKASIIPLAPLLLVLLRYHKSLY